MNGTPPSLSPAKIDELLQGIETLAAAKNEDLEIEEEKRLRLYNAAREIMLRVESHHASVQRIDGTVTQLAIIKLAYDTNLFAELVRREEATVSDLAAATGIEKALLFRILRYCAAHRMVANVGKDKYKATNITRDFTTPGFQGAITYHRATLMRAAYALPDFFAKTGYVTPIDRRNGPLQHALGSTEHIFEYLDNNPLIGESFNNYMASLQISDVKLDSSYDFDRLWGNDTTDETILFVDIGGGVGHQTKALRDSKLTKGRFILQDLPAVVEDLHIENVEVMPHDFFNEQPIKGAKAYYFRTVLHDWPDVECRTILDRIRDAMEEDSILLLEERVMPDEDPHWVAVNLDLTMMLLLAALERSQTQWAELLNSVGLELKSCVETSNSGVCIIEAIKMPTSSQSH